MSTAASNSLKACRHSAHLARCACTFFCSSSVRSPEVETAPSARNSSCGPISDHSPAPLFPPLFAISFSNSHSTPKHFFPQPIQPPVVVVPHISPWLAQLFADLCERISFKEIQPQRFSLILG